MAKVTAIIAVFACVCICSTQSGEDDDYLKAKAKRAKNAGDATGENQWVDDLADFVEWEKELNFKGYFDFVFMNLKKDGTPKSIPAVERFMNLASDDDNRRASAFHIAATECWLELKSREGGEAARLEAAMSVVKPGSTNTPDSLTCCQVIQRAGKTVRPRIYETLTNSAIHDAATAGTLAYLLTDPSFAPSDTEIQAILEKAGQLGRRAMFYYLEKRSDARAVPLILQFLKSDISDVAYSGIYALENYKKSPHREALVDAACVFFDSITIEKWKNDTEYMRWTTLWLIRKTGPTANAKIVAAKFLEKYSSLDGLDDVRRSGRKTAIEEARAIMDGK